MRFRENSLSERIRQSIAHQLPPDRKRIHRTREKLFMVSCSGCHGVEGRGNGPQVAQSEPKPSDLSTGYCIMILYKWMSVAGSINGAQMTFHFRSSRIH